MNSNGSLARMSRTKVYLTRKIPSPGFEIISDKADVVMNEVDLPPSREELLRNVADADGLLCLLTDKIDEEVMSHSPKLKIISSLSVGYDHIDVEAATSRGIYVAYTPRVLTDATADFTWALLMTTARRVAEADRLIKNGEWNLPWSPFFMLGTEVSGKTLGILGLGRIGSEVARRAMGFKMKTIYYDVIRAPPEKEKELSARFVDLETLLQSSDFISIHLSLSEQTIGLIDASKLKLMKSNAILVNTARGNIIDENALIRALQEGWIRGAGLDVYCQEPINPNHAFLSLKNVVLAPHLASATTETRSKMAEIAANNLISALSGIEPQYVVNPKVGRTAGD